MSDELHEAILNAPDKIWVQVERLDVHDYNPVSIKGSEYGDELVYVRQDLYSQAVSAVEERLKKAHELLDKSYDAIMTAISAEDGLDGQAGVDLANEIRDVIPDGSFVKAWNDPELPEV